MSFRIFIFIFLVSGCGVKGPPLPKNTSLPSAIENDYPELNVAPGLISGD